MSAGETVQGTPLMSDRERRARNREVVASAGRAATEHIAYVEAHKFQSQPSELMAGALQGIALELHAIRLILHDAAYGTGSISTTEVTNA